MSPDTLIVIPAYNEQQMISSVLNELVQFPYRIVVVDDGSSDQTSLAALRFPVTVLRHISNLGQGAALQTGISYALSQPGAAYLVTFDADGQHHARDVEEMLRVCREGKYDVVLGSRFLKNGEAENISAFKWIVLRMATLFTRMVTGLKITDTHNGLRVFKAESAARLNITHNGMAHASEILFQIAAHRMRYCEVPVRIVYSSYSTKKGQSVWNGINILWDIIVGRIR